MPKISIITVTYNCSNLLEKTIESVALQSFNDFEHIVIDGNSSDHTVEVIKNNQDKITYWISEPDKGIYDAMNKGLKAAKGEYVIFMNAGDTFFEKDTLNKIPFTAYPDADIFYGEAMIVDENNNQLGLRRKKLPSKLNWKHFKNGMVVCHQSVLIKRSIAPYYNLQYRYASDIDWVIKSLKLSTQVIYVNNIISSFVQGGFSTQNLKKSWLDRFHILNSHFGLVRSLLSHIVFIFENLFLKIGVIPQFRKNYL